MSSAGLLGLAEVLLGIASVGVAVPAGMLLLECVAAAWPPGAVDPDAEGPDSPAPRPRAAVLIPAHDEEAGLADTLASLTPQLRPGDRLLVVADNCRDATAEVARRGGAEVVERHDAERRGKGWALRFGMQALRDSDVETVVVVDADSRCAPGALDALVATSARHRVPVQARYAFEPPADPTPGQALSALALLVRNHVRPLGLARLVRPGGPCPLFGCGMAFPRALLERHPPRGESVVEDLEHGIDLTCAGYPPRYVPEARVTSALPRDGGAAREQRRRWEHGHLHALLRGVPRLLAAGLGGGGRAPIALGLDLWIPPLSLHLALGAALLALGAGLWALGGTPFVAVAAALSLAGSVAGLGLAWARFGRELASPADLLAAPLYAARKLPLYAGFLVRRQREWRRTPRDSVGGKGGADSEGSDG